MREHSKFLLRDSIGVPHQKTIFLEKKIDLGMVIVTNARANLSQNDLTCQVFLFNVWTIKFQVRHYSMCMTVPILHLIFVSVPKHFQ